MNASIRLIILFVITCFIASKAVIIAHECSHSQQVVEEILTLADVQINGKRPWDITVHNEEFYQRVLKDHQLGLGESYMEGWWDCNALDECMFRILRADLEKNLTPTWAMRFALLKSKLFNRQDKSGSKRVIDLHYQLGN